MNLVILKGRLTKDIELKTSSNGTSYLNNSIAVDRKYSKGEEKQTDFFNISVCGKTAEFVSKYFSKGSAILIKGRIENNVVEKDGHKNTYTSIMVDEVEFCESKSDSKPKENDFINVAAEIETELPF